MCLVCRGWSTKPWESLSTNWDPGDSWWSWNLSIQVGIGRIGDFHAAAPRSHHGRDVWICMVEMIGVMRTRRRMMVGKWWWWWLWCLRISVETAHHKKTQMPLNPRTWKSGRKLPQIDLLWSRNLGFKTAASQLSRAPLELADWISPNDVAHYSIPFFFPREDVGP